MVDIDLSDKSLIYKVGVSIALLRYQLGRLILVFQPPLNVDSTTYVVSIKLRSTRICWSLKPWLKCSAITHHHLSNVVSV